MTVPYTPTPFATPVLNPSSISILNSVPYLTLSEFRFQPTAIDTTSLVPGATQQSQNVALSQVIDRASGWVDDYVFHGAGGVLAASVNTEAGWVRPGAGGRSGWTALVCKYKPIISVIGVAIGAYPGTLASLTTNAAKRIGITTPVITVPTSYGNSASVPYLGANPPTGPNGMLYAAWTYVNGFPHTFLASSATQGATSIEVQSTLGFLDGTGFMIGDYTNGGLDVEYCTATGTTGSTIALQSPTRYAHKLPAKPDGITVTALPPVIRQATMLLITALIKVQGDNSLVLQEIRQPTQIQETAGGMSQDVRQAKLMLDPFRTTDVRKN